MNDVPDYFKPVIEKHGREMFTYVYNSNMAGEALEVLARKGRADIVHACGVLGAAYNQLADAYGKLKAWTPEELRQCEMDIMLAFSQAIENQGPQGGGRKILLN